MDFINHQLFIKDINVHIDPILPKKTAIITHGHADHARFGHDHVIATRQTIDIMKFATEINVRRNLLLSDTVKNTRLKTLILHYTLQDIF